MFKYYFSLIFFFYSTLSFSQDIKYAHEVIDTLTSVSMHGRGYVKQGDKIAAEYIQHEFAKFDLKHFGNDYKQPFSFPVNTYPDTVDVIVDGKKLVAGEDFIIYPRANSIKGNYKIQPFDSTSLSNAIKKNEIAKLHLDEKFLLIDETKDHSKVTHDLRANPFHSKGIIVIENKLTWTVSTDISYYPIIEVLSGKIKNAKRISVNIHNVFIPKYDTQNLVGYIQGKEAPDSFIVFTAHYDHLGMLGSTAYFPGANDNASGTSMLLNLAEYYSSTNHQSKYSIAFISFAGEEAGLLGSKYYTDHPLFPLTRIKFLINMDLMGTGDEGIMVVNATEYKRQFNLLKNINDEKKYLKSIGERDKAKNSDHYYFSEKGVPCFFFYTLGGIKAYHDVYDRSATLPLSAYENVFRLITDFVKGME